jgi:hypothetical protein
MFTSSSWSSVTDIYSRINIAFVISYTNWVSHIKIKPLYAHIHTHSLALRTQDSKHCSYDVMSIHNVHSPCQCNRTIPPQQRQRCETQHSHSSVTGDSSLLVCSTFSEMKAIPSFNTSEKHTYRYSITTCHAYRHSVTTCHAYRQCYNTPHLQT